MILRYLIFAPGYIVLWLMFYFPSENGKNRNVARGRRAWNNRHIMAPVYTLMIYSILLFLFWDVFMIYFIL